MQAYANIKAEDEKVKIVAEAEARSEGDIVEEFAGIDGCARAVLIGLHQPYVPGIEEDGAFEGSYERETILNVSLQLEVSDLVYVAPS